MLQGEMVLRIWDVQHGACAMLCHHLNGSGGRLAMIDSGDTPGWSPSEYITTVIGRNTLDYLFITNADQDHMSDLHGLWEAGITIPVLFRNPTYSAPEIYEIKKLSGPLTRDTVRYVRSCLEYNQPPDEPFDQHMGGITAATFCNPYPQFTKTNDLSLVVFIDYGPFKILFPGDLEKQGWRALLNRADFRAQLANVDVLVASHHGRENGFCAEVFDYCYPRAVVISDKPIEHDTQLMTPDYRQVVRDEGVHVRTTGRTRHVLTTRRDGWIQFTVDGTGGFFIDTECKG